MPMVYRNKMYTKIEETSVIKSIINFSVGFDAMGLTDNANPIGLMPFLNPGLGILGWDIFHTYLIEF